MAQAHKLLTERQARIRRYVAGAGLIASFFLAFASFLWFKHIGQFDQGMYGMLLWVPILGLFGVLGLICAKAIRGLEIMPEGELARLYETIKWDTEAKQILTEWLEQGKPLRRQDYLYLYEQKQTKDM